MGYANTQPDKLRFFLTTSSVADRQLDFSPSDWEESSISITRDLSKFYGNRREYSLPLGFVKEARSLLKDEFFLNGASGYAVVRVEVLDSSTWLYKPLYTGKVDFSKTDLDKDFIELNFLDSDLQAIKEAYEDTDFEIQLGEGFEDNDDVVLPPVLFTETVTMFGGGDTFWNINVGGSSGLQDHCTMRTDIYNSKIRLDGITFFNQGSRVRGHSLEEFSMEDPLFIPNKENLDLRIKFEALASFNISNSGYYMLMLGWKKIDPETQAVSTGSYLAYDFSDWGDPGVYDEKIISFDTTFLNLEQGASFFLYTVSVPTGPEGGNLRIEWHEIKLDFEYVDTAPEHRVMSTSPFFLFRSLFRKMSGNNLLPVKSDFLQSIEHVRIISGDSIRQFVKPGNTNPVILTNFEDFFKSFDAIFGLGFDIIDGVPTIERKEFFLNRSVEISDVGEVRDVRVSLDQDFIVNTIKAGYSKQDYDENWGKEEINNGQTWKTPVEAGKKTLDLTCPYRTDAYGINEIRSEILMGQVNNDTNQDKATDNDVFIVWGDPNGYNPGYSYTDPAYNPPRLVVIPDSWDVLTLDQATSYSGIKDNPFYFNWMLTPKRNLIRNGSFLNSLLYGETNQASSVVMTAADKWFDFEVEYQSEVFSEGAEIEIASLPAPLLSPFLVTLEASFPLDFYKKYIENDLTGYVSFWHNGSRFMLYIKEISFNIADRSAFEIKGLLLPGQEFNILFR